MVYFCIGYEIKDIDPLADTKLRLPTAPHILKLSFTVFIQMY